MGPHPPNRTIVSTITAKPKQDHCWDRSPVRQASEPSKLLTPPRRTLSRDLLANGRVAVRVDALSVRKRCQVPIVRSTRTFEKGVRYR